MTDTPMRERIVEAMLEARNLSEVFGWSDGMTEGVARIEKMLTEKQLDAVLEVMMEPDEVITQAGQRAFSQSFQECPFDDADDAACFRWIWITTLEALKAKDSSNG